LQQLITPFLIAWLSGLVLVPIIRRLAFLLGFVDTPNNRKIHTRPIPRVGGVAIFLATLFGAVPFLAHHEKLVGLILASSLMFLIGLLDDIWDLPPKVKLIGQFLACTILILFHVRIEFVSDFMRGEGLVAIGYLAYPVTFLWVIGLTNTINLVDGVDGLAGGIVFIALATLLATRLLTPYSQDPAVMSGVLALTAALMGSVLAFLRYNVFPARIFMGDCGAYYLGFLTAGLSIVGGAKGSILLPLVIPLITFGLPLLDVILAILRRLFNRVPIFQADKEHLHHKLMRNGFTQSETTRFLWMVSTCFGLVAILTSGAYHRGITLTVVFLLLGMIFCAGVFFVRTLKARQPLS
jgi:UDP-GlcNAc:undecaprenyl-phosphate GlcNAc-1-phosphate transferase